MREELEKRLGSLQQELSEVTAAKNKALRNLNSVIVREELEKRLGSLQHELAEATAAKHKVLRDQNSS
jgi:uncharacterized small protein (DUF1192 family)